MTLGMAMIFWYNTKGKYTNTNRKYTKSES